MTVETTYSQGVENGQQRDNPIKKASFNLYQSDIDALKELAAWRGTNATIALRGAIATERLLQQASKNGDTILLESKDGKLSRIIFR